MNSIKCGQCGFTNWATAENCKKCSASLAYSAPSSSAPQPKLNYPIQKPSAFQIMKNDALACVSIILPFVMWGIYIAMTVFGVSFKSKRSGTVVENSEGNIVILIVPIVLTVLCLALFFWRLTSIQKIFESGERVVGKIIDVAFFKDRGQIEFSYNHNRQNFQSSLGIMKNSKTQSYRPGDDVVLIVDPSNPSRALIQDLYITQNNLR